MFYDAPHRYIKDEYEFYDTGMREVGCNGLVDKPIKEKVCVGEIDYTHEFEIMQFTGLNDRFNKGIYEGDIVKIFTIPDNEKDYESGLSVQKHVVVEWSLGMWNICDNQIYTFIPRDVEVIGNKYENGDLL